MKPAGERIGGRYLLGRSLGAGRAGQVFEATDTKTRTRVALKLRDPTSSSELDIERAGLRSIEHPHLLHILDAGDHHGRPFVVMELAEHGSLAARPRPMSHADLSTLATQLLEGLAFLHAQGILHGDVKTENILLTSIDPLVFKLSDFGLAQRSVDVAAGTTHGSPAYMPPEIIRGDPVDERSDLYSLGVTLYEAAFAELPFDDEDVRTLLMRHLTEMPRRLRVPGGTDPRLFALLRRLLAKEPAERPQDARAALAVWRGDEAAAPRWIPPRLGVLIGRDQELAALEKALEGDAAVVSIEGPPGIGKTRLLSEFALRAELRGTPTHWWTPDGITGAGSSGVVARGDWPGDVPDPSVHLPEIQAQQALATLGPAGSLLIIDNLDASPSSFQDSVAFLLRDVSLKPQNARLVCIAGRDVHRLCVQALAVGGFSPPMHISLSPWPPTMVQQALASFLGAMQVRGALLDLLVTSTGGIPENVEVACKRLVEQDLLRFDAANGVTVAAGTKAQQVFDPAQSRTTDWLRRMPAPQLDFLRLLAVLHRPLTSEELPALAPGMVSNIPELIRRGVILTLRRPSGEVFSLAHEGIRRALLDSMEVREQRARHDFIASRLRSLSSQDLDEISWHEACGSHLPTVRLAISTLEEHGMLFKSPERLRGAFENLLALATEDDSNSLVDEELKYLDLLHQMGEYELVIQRASSSAKSKPSPTKFPAYLGRLSKAHLALGRTEEAIRALKSIPPAEFGLEARVIQAHALFNLGKHREVIDSCTGILTNLDLDEPLAERLLDTLASSLTVVGEFSRAREILNTAIDRARSRGNGLSLANSLHRLGVVEFYQGHMPHAESLFLEAKPLFESSSDRRSLVRVLNSLAALAAEGGRFIEAKDNLQTALDLCRSLGETDSLSYVLGNLSRTLTVQAQYTEALQRIEEGLRIGQLRRLSTNYIQNQIIRGEILAALNVRDEAMNSLNPLLEEVRGQLFEGQIQMILGDVCLNSRDFESASRWLEWSRSVLERNGAEDELVTLDILDARLAYRTGATPAASTGARRASERAHALKLIPQQVEAGVLLSEIFLEASPSESGDVARAALRLAKDANLAEATWRLQRTLARLALRDMDRSSAVRFYGESVGTLQMISLHIPPDASDFYFSHEERKALFDEVRTLKTPS